MGEKIQALLYSIGITGNYIGFYQAASAIEIVPVSSLTMIVMESVISLMPTAARCLAPLLMVTKGLYLEVAEQYGTDWKTVERNIRTVISVTWNCSRRKLEMITGHPLSKKPTPAQFIAILSRYLQDPDSNGMERPGPHEVSLSAVSADSL